MKITHILNLPSEITVLEFLADENTQKREETIICIHWWGGRGTNFLNLSQNWPKMDLEF